MADKSHIPPAKEEVERRFRLILDEGDIKDLSSLLDEPYGTLVKKLNPAHDSKSDIYKAVRVLWSLQFLEDGERKAREALDLLNELTFPSADAIQLASRIERDAKRLREMLSEGAR